MALSQQLRARADDVLELHEAGDLEEALTAVESLISDAQQAGAADDVVRETLFMGWFERAVLLTEVGEVRAAITAYTEAEAVPADVSDPDQRHEIAMARDRKSVV